MNLDAIKTTAEGWLGDNQNTSSDYEALVGCIKSGEKIYGLAFDNDERSVIVLMSHAKEPNSKVFIVQFESEPPLGFTETEEFLDYCDKANLVYKKPDPLSSIRKTMEIANDAANFEAVSFPLNTLNDVYLICTMIERATKERVRE